MAPRAYIDENGKLWLDGAFCPEQLDAARRVGYIDLVSDQPGSVGKQITSLLRSRIPAGWRLTMVATRSRRPVPMGSVQVGQIRSSSDEPLRLAFLVPSN